ncbi:hypothetical protein IC575_024481 [Cucumis melo]
MNWSVDDLDHGGATLFRSDVVRVVPCYSVRHRYWSRVRQRGHASTAAGGDGPFLPRHGHCCGRRAPVTVHGRCGDATAGIGGRIESMKLNGKKLKGVS